MSVGHRSGQSGQDEPRFDENVHDEVPDDDGHQAAAARDIRDRVKEADNGRGRYGAKEGRPVDLRCKESPAHMCDAEKNTRRDYLNRGTEAGPFQFVHYETTKKHFFDETSGNSCRERIVDVKSATFGQRRMPPQPSQSHPEVKHAENCGDNPAVQGR